MFVELFLLMGTALGMEDNQEQKKSYARPRENQSSEGRRTDRQTHK